MGAQINLFNMYGLGKGVRRDEAEAARWLRKAAEQGDAYSEYNLGILYFDGRGVSKDDAEAVRWLQKATGQGNAEAKGALEKYAQIQNEAAAQAKKEVEERASEPKTCYDFSVIFKATSQTRRQFAVDSIQKMNETVGYGIVNVNAAGDDNKYLLFFSTPQNESILRQVANGMTSTEDIRMNFCMQGFAEVQFLVRDATQNQKLITRYITTTSGLTKYVLDYNTTHGQ